MPAFLMPGGSKRIVVDRVFTLGGGRQLCELQGQFFSMNGQFLEDEELAKLLPEPFKTRALKFVTSYKTAKVKEEAVPVPEATPDEVQGHVMSEELRQVLDIRTSEERMREERR